MGTLSFLEDAPQFDGECVRFHGIDGEKHVICGVTTYALKHCSAKLPHYGLLPAEAFISAFEELMTDIHRAARIKYEKGDFEPSGAISIMVHRADIAP